MTVRTQWMESWAGNEVNASVDASNDPFPAAEQVLIDWMLSVPRGVNLEAAARQQIALIDKRALMHPELQYLRTLFVGIAGECNWRGTFTHL